MKLHNKTIHLSPSDLSLHSNCVHATTLDLRLLRKEIAKPDAGGSFSAALQEKGEAFEQAFLQALEGDGKYIVRIDRNSANADAETMDAIKSEAEVIYQARLCHEIWNGWADFLIRVDVPSNLGNWSYEVWDTKLSRETKSGAILQTCLYSEMLEVIQGRLPEHMHIKTPARAESYRVDDFMAYYRQMKGKLLQAINVPESNTYPEPVDHCSVCKWWKVCDQQRRQDDHLSFIAGMGRSQIREVEHNNVNTLAGMAALYPQVPFKPTRGSAETLNRLARQARLQQQSREENTIKYELLDREEKFGFYQLPEPTEHDMFLDFEGDPFVGNSGLEYLFGWVAGNQYHHIWVRSEKEEKEALEQFMDNVMTVFEKHPGMHIYHFGHYEETALKRMVGKYATRIDELDRLLRGQVFVNLHRIFRQAVIAGVESYSLKPLEKLHGYIREADLRDVGPAKAHLETALEGDSFDDVGVEILEMVRQYNEDDCRSTIALQKWLEERRQELENRGETISRPVAGSGDPSDDQQQKKEEIQRLFNGLLEGVSFEKEERTPEQQARWLLAHMLEWYWREKKTKLWKRFELRSLKEDELLDEKTALAHLRFTGEVVPDKKSFVCTYGFPDQECELKEGDGVEFNESPAGKIVFIDTERRVIKLRQGPTVRNIRPTYIISCGDNISDKKKEDAIFNLAAWVMQHGVDDPSAEWKPARELLMGKLPQYHDKRLVLADVHKNPIAAVQQLSNSVLPIQGPPGTGKSFNAARMILSLVAEGKKVGITALSHKVITGLLQKVVERAKKEKQMVPRMLQKVREESAVAPEWTEITHSPSASEVEGASVVAGTPFMWAQPDLRQAVDVMFVDEAGQLSLVDTLALSQAAKNLVLLGDPQQLKQPSNASHPEGTEASALEHVLQGRKTIAPEQGVFLEETWRMHPHISKYVSELFYDSRLKVKDANERQRLTGNTRFAKPGIYLEPVPHEGNQSASAEEVQHVLSVTKELLDNKLSFVQSDGIQVALDKKQIKIIAPYNAQVNDINEALKGRIQVGTVDKFQGQEAAVIICSLATSSPEDAPRGMEFLYSLNRLNVAVSRARAVFILVASPKLFEPDCRSPHQMRLANALCRLREVAIGQ